MEHDEFFDCRFERKIAVREHLQLLEPALWQKIFPWEPPTVDLYSPLRPEELLVRGNLSPDFWQRLPGGEKLARIGKEKDRLRPAWWQQLFFWMSPPKPATTDEEVIKGFRKMLKNSLKPAWWQRPFQRMPKLPD